MRSSKMPPSRTPRPCPVPRGVWSELAIRTSELAYVNGSTRLSITISSHASSRVWVIFRRIRTAAG